MPEQMQRQIAETRCALTITTNDLELPWELMHAQGRFLSLDRPVARMPMGRALPPGDRAAAPRADRLLRFLLIYADPDKNLANAEQEIETVRQYLEQDWKSRIRVEILTGPRATGRKLNEVLRSGTYDVIHYAGHAHFDQESHELSGLYLGTKESNEVFFAQKIRRLMAGRPLVFLNACETGVTANEAQGQERVTYFQQPAEGLASAFIYGGALGCIGSLWPVYDKPAAEFAVEFYKRLLEGYMVGEALRATRAEIKERYPDQIAWASYLYYGDPTAVLAE
jgi:CHAT domain-containing protein